MLVNFSLQNWKSFKHENTFSMEATGERQHGFRIPHISKYRMRVLPISLIFGGNASGKSNLCKALSFVQSYIVEGIAPHKRIPIDRYRLNNETQVAPLDIAIEILVDDLLYEYSFRVNEEKVLFEELIKKNSNQSHMLFTRENGMVRFNDAQKDLVFLQFVARATRDNQLFLTSCMQNNVSDFAPVYMWFRDSLRVLSPESQLQPIEYFFDEANPVATVINEAIRGLDTGVDHVGCVDVDMINGTYSMLFQQIVDDISRKIESGQSYRFSVPGNRDRFIATLDENGFSVKKLVAFHKTEDGMYASFGFSGESDGTERAIDLLPAILDLSEVDSTMVYVIDEFDRSLHANMTRAMLEYYLDSCNSARRAQLIFTTHQDDLMDQSILRRDEIWLTERDEFGATELITLGDFSDLRYDKDIRKSYMQGRFGGLPNIVI